MIVVAPPAGTLETLSCPGVVATGFGFRITPGREAVAAGMVLAARLSARVAGLPPADAERLAAVLGRAGLPLVPPPLSRTRWLELMARDKKVEAGVIRFVLLEALGRAVVRAGVSAEDLAAVLG